MTHSTTRERDSEALPESGQRLESGAVESLDGSGGGSGSTSFWHSQSFLSTAMFVMFFISGFCSLAYQTVWLRLAFASFGVITPVVSVIVSVFMLGLGIGSWYGGKHIVRLTRKTGKPALFFYGLAELIIGLGAFAVPLQFYIGKSLLLTSGESDSFGYLLGSALAITSSVIVWAVAMGTTFPFGVAFMKTAARSNSRSFSFLYLANVAGAVAGTLATVVFLVEWLGFKHALMAVACLNFVIGAFALIWSSRVKTESTGAVEAERQASSAAVTANPAATANPNSSATSSTSTTSTSTSTSTSTGAPSLAAKLSSADLQSAYLILFATGFVSMAMEVVWTRAFCKSLGTWVYSFAALLATYLASTFVGSYVYRKDSSRSAFGAGSGLSKALLLSLTAASGFLPVVLNDPRFVKAALSPLGTAFPLAQGALALSSIVPFCGFLGYLTPLVIDESSSGDAETVGKAYAVNTLGCIVGPLLSGYLLLPWLGAKNALIVLSVMLVALAAKYFSQLSKPAVSTLVPAQLLLLFFSFGCLNLEEPYVKEKLHIVRDYAATVSAWGEGMRKQLCVNGYSMTALTPVTKYIAHLPVAFHKGKPDSILVICFGMGTTFRSMMSWDTKVTAVELAGGVKDCFDYYFDDAAKLRANPKGRIVVDDGRRFLTRGKESFDIIVLDPPPPVEAAGSSLLYSKDFYKVMKQHLRPGGILQQWFPGGEYAITQAVVRSVMESFPYVRVYCSPEEPHVNGYHILASLKPIPQLTADQVLERMPAAAKADLAEWEPLPDKQANMKSTLKKVLASEIEANKLLNADPAVRITDDHPYNEYCMMRRLKAWFEQTH